ncbi:hypothetical protein AGMMS50229_18630 [Campylobacterota bacterium]|nr:hypothetical protein AGMMS50229_18630 [Campylobacterota bacterium]
MNATEHINAALIALDFVLSSGDFSVLEEVRKQLDLALAAIASYMKAKQ